MSSPTGAPPKPVAPVSTSPVTSKQLRKWIGPLALGLVLLLIPAPSSLTVGSGGRSLDLHLGLSVLLIPLPPLSSSPRSYSRLKPSHRIFCVRSFPGRRDTDTHS